jgi:hypothetical protein
VCAAVPRPLCLSSLSAAFGQPPHRRSTDRPARFLRNPLVGPLPSCPHFYLRPPQSRRPSQTSAHVAASDFCRRARRRPDGHARRRPQRSAARQPLVRPRLQRSQIQDGTVTFSLSLCRVADILFQDIECQVEAGKCEHGMFLSTHALLMWINFCSEDSILLSRGDAL